jgi:hypothetical protein
MIKSRWSEQEDKVLLRQVKAYPQNLKRAFEFAAESLDRTPNACATRWYSVVSKKEDKQNTCFITLSKNSWGRNRKNCKHDLPKFTKASLWNKILKFFFK